MEELELLPGHALPCSMAEERGGSTLASSHLLFSPILTSPQSPPYYLNPARSQLCANLGIAAHRKQPSSDTGTDWEKGRQTGSVSTQSTWEENYRYDALYIQFTLYVLEKWSESF